MLCSRHLFSTVSRYVLTLIVQLPLWFNFKSIPPPEQHASERDQCLDSQDNQDVPQCQPVFLGAQTIVLFTDQDKFGWIVGNHAVDLLANAPAHHLGFIDCPDEDCAVSGTSIAEEAVTSGTNEGLL